MTYEDAIKTLEVTIIEWKYPIGYEEVVALEMAIRALQAKLEAEKNEPLTLDELRDMDGVPVWFSTDYETDKGWHICHGEYQDRYIACDSGDCYDFRTFVEKRIVAYRHKPEEKWNGV